MRFPVSCRFFEIAGTEFRQVTYWNHPISRQPANGTRFHSQGRRLVPDQFPVWADLLDLRQPAQGKLHHLVPRQSLLHLVQDEVQNPLRPAQ